MMAFSKSIRKGQSPIMCNLCERDNKINWKCLNCDVLMCDKCKEKLHPKFKSFKDHKVISIKEVGQHPEELDFSHIKCHEHSTQVCVMFCDSCDKLVCPQCITEVHNGHKLVDIKDGYQKHSRNLIFAQKRVQMNIEELNKTEIKIKLLKNHENTLYAEEEKTMEHHRLELKMAVDEHIDALKKELNQKWGVIKKSIDQEADRVNTTKKKMVDQNSMAEDIMNSKDPEKVFKNSSGLQKSMQEPMSSPELKFNSMPKFIAGEITKDNVGSLHDVTTDITIKCNHKFKTKIGAVFKLATNPDGSLWIRDKKVVQKVRPEGNNLKICCSINIESSDMALTQSNDLLLATIESTVKQISSITGELTNSVYTVAPLVVICVHVTKNQKVLVGARTPGEPFPATGRRALIVMSKDGTHEASYEHDRNNKSLFTLVRQITSTSTGTILTLDRLSSDGTGRVVVLAQDGEVLHYYNCHPDSNTEAKPFKPRGIVTTPSDRVILSELDNSILHILNSVGHLITCYNTSDIGIKYPFSLSFNTAGQLYIGCTTPDGSKDHGKLYQVDITGV